MIYKGYNITRQRKMQSKRYAVSKGDSLLSEEDTLELSKYYINTTIKTLKENERPLI